MSISEMRKPRLKKVNLSQHSPDDRSNSYYFDHLICARLGCMLIPYIISFNSQITSVSIILNFTLAKIEAQIGSRMWDANPEPVWFQCKLFLPRYAASEVLNPTVQSPTPGLSPGLLDRKEFWKTPKITFLLFTCIVGSVIYTPYSLIYTWWLRIEESPFVFRVLFRFHLRPWSCSFWHWLVLDRTSLQDLPPSGWTGWETRRPPPGCGASGHSRPKGDLRGKISIPSVGGLPTEPHCKGNAASNTNVRPCSLAVQDTKGDTDRAPPSSLLHCYYPVSLAMLHHVWRSGTPFSAWNSLYHYC